MFAPNLRRKIFGWLERLKNSAGFGWAIKKIWQRRGSMPKNSARRLAAAAEGSTLMTTVTHTWCCSTGLVSNGVC